MHTMKEYSEKVKKYEEEGEAEEEAKEMASEDLQLHYVEKFKEYI